MADPNFTKGKWFVRSDFWIYPFSDRVLSVIEKNLKEVKKKEREFTQQHPRGSSVKKNLKRGKKEEEAAQQHPQSSSVLEREAEALDSKVQSLVHWIAEIGSLNYNAQPEWSLSRWKAASIDDACGIIKEFIGLAELASETFDWEHSFVLPKMKWMKHSWKHISMADLEKIAGDVRSGAYPFSDLSPPIDLFESGDEVIELFLRAAQRDPSAVTRLNVLFPSKQTQREVAEHYFCGVKPLDAVRSMVSGIPEPEDLAAEYTSVAITNPDSGEAEKARNELRLLVAKAAAKSSRGRKGRPRIPFGEETVARIYKMSYALFKQANEVNRLLSNTIQRGSSLEKEARRDSQLRKFYPWLARHFPKSHEIGGFLQSQPAAGACKLAGIVLEVSPSKVSKTVFK